MRVFLFCFLFLLMVRIPGFAQVGTLVVTSPAFQNNGVIPAK